MSAIEPKTQVSLYLTKKELAFIRLIETKFKFSRNAAIVHIITTFADLLRQDCLIEE